MPQYTIRFSNTSHANQDWILSDGNHFTLVPSQVAYANVNLAANYTLRVAVSTDGGIAAADLVYTLATHNWALQTHTPNEWVFREANTIVTLSCRLEDVVHPGAKIKLALSEPQLEKS